MRESRKFRYEREEKSERARCEAKPRSVAPVSKVFSTEEEERTVDRAGAI